jgi:Arc/MetJ-type ribon-helix-helix transcriptional regulator
MKTITISVEDSEYEKLESKVQNLDYNTVSEYLNFLISTTLDDDSFEDSKNDEEQDVKEKLKELGYL